jgi:hypothetical protein
MQYNLEKEFLRFIESNDVFESTQTIFILVLFNVPTSIILIISMGFFERSPSKRKIKLAMMTFQFIIMVLTFLFVRIIDIPTENKIINDFDNAGTPYSYAANGKDFHLLGEYNQNSMLNFLEKYTIKSHQKNHYVVLMRIQFVLQEILSDTSSAKSFILRKIKDTIVKIKENINTRTENVKCARLVDLMMYCYVSTNDKSFLDLATYNTTFDRQARIWMGYYIRREQNVEYLNGKITHLE